MAAMAVGMRTRSFEEQVETLVGLGLAEDEDAFRSALEQARPDAPVERSVLVASRELIPVADLAARVERHGKLVVLGHLEPADLATFVPIEAIELPDSPAYLAVDVDLGAGSRNVRPEDALQPKLGWCWDRNPHTWLGTASCAKRIAG